MKKDFSCYLELQIMLNNLDQYITVQNLFEFIKCIFPLSPADQQVAPNFP